MAFDSARSRYVRVWRRTFAKSATYHSMTLGTLSIDIQVRRDVEVMDESGGYSRRAMARIESGRVKPQSGDWFEQEGERWVVEQLNSDNGYLTQVMIRPQL